MPHSRTFPEQDVLNLKQNRSELTELRQHSSELLLDWAWFCWVPFGGQNPNSRLS